MSISFDTHSSEEVMEIFQRLNREQKLTMVVVTHDAEIGHHARRIVVFRDGQIRQDYPVTEQMDARDVLRELDAARQEETEEEAAP
jgi:putative ABC transport system ATP-binding protein